MRDYKLGLIARCDNGGLGIESMEFHKNLQPEKVLCVLDGYDNFPERFPGCIKTDLNPTDGQVADFLEGLDTVFTIETPYNWSLFPMARKRGIRTVMKVNYEWLEDHSYPDLYVAPNLWHFNDYPVYIQLNAGMTQSQEDGERFLNGKKVISLPIDPERFKFRERTEAKTFLHIVGHDAGYDRNGTSVLAQAIPLVKSDVRFIFRSQIPHYRWKAWQAYRSQFSDPRVTIIDQEVEDRATLYDEGDVLVMPRRYGGQSLAMEEAAMCGIHMITTNMQPQSSMFPIAMFIGVGELSKIRIKTEVEYANPDPYDLAYMIDTLSKFDSCSMVGLSHIARDAVKDRTWEPWIKALEPR